LFEFVVAGILVTALERNLIPPLAARSGLLTPR
jgi:hypothetical protein